jgi:hypothetical protein
MNEEAIPAIPPNVIRPFLSQPLIVEANELDAAARIVATQQDRVFLGNGDLAYVTNADPCPGDWQIYRNGKPCATRRRNDILGYEAFYLGTAKQLQPGNPATFEMRSATQEDRSRRSPASGDPPPLVAYVPHKPDFAVDGRVISSMAASTQPDAARSSRSTVGTRMASRSDMCWLSNVIA